MSYRDEWKDTKLSEVCLKIGSGATPRGGKNSYLEFGEIALIRSQNILDFYFSYTGLAYINKEQAKKLKNVIIQKDDVLINITGDSVARVCQVPNEVIPARVNQHVSILRCNQNLISPQFLKYCLLSKKYKSLLLNISSTGATRNALTKAMLENFKLNIPLLPTQNRIAFILSAFDEKIEVNRQMNATLEAMAQAMFREMCLPDDEENLEEGWEWKKIGDLYRTKSGGTPRRKNPEYYENGEYLWVKSKELKDNFVFETEEQITEDALNNSSAKLIPPFSLLVAMYGATVGEFSILGKEAACNQAICAIISKKDYKYSFIYSYLKEFRQDLISRAVGSAQQNISQVVIKQFEILCPPKSIVNEFQNNVEPLFLKMLSNLEENQELAKSRDLLLPKLMSGEIEV